MTIQPISSDSGTSGEPRRLLPEAALAAALFLLALASIFLGAATSPLMDPDEGRNAEVAREMAESGDFVVPHLNALPYLDKPIFFFAASALSIRAFGATDLAARLPSVLFLVATAALVFAVGCRLCGRRCGWLAALALVTSPLAIVFGRTAIFDSAFAFWVAASCTAFFLGCEGGGTRWRVGGWIATGMAVLTKGPVGLVLPLLINISYALVRYRGVERWRGMARLFHPLGLVAFLAVVLPWFLAVVVRHPEFPHYAFVRETFARVATDELSRTGPVHYFVPFLVGGAFPWSLFLILGAPWLPALWRAGMPPAGGDSRPNLGAEAGGGSGPRDEGRPFAYLLLWIAVPLVFFTISQSKRPGYILPIFPALVLVAARLSLEAPVRRILTGMVAAFMGLVGIALLVASGPISALLEKHPEAIDLVRVHGPWVGGVALAAAAAMSLGVRRLASPALVGTLALFPILGAFAAQGLVDAGLEARSPRPVAEAIRARVPGPVSVVGVDTFPHSLAFYLESPILVSTGRASKMRSNYIREYEERLRAVPNSTLRPADWWKEQLRSCPVPTVFVIMSEDKDLFPELGQELPILVETSRWIAYGPCKEHEP